MWVSSIPRTRVLRTSGLYVGEGAHSGVDITWTAQIQRDYYSDVHGHIGVSRWYTCSELSYRIRIFYIDTWSNQIAHRAGELTHIYGLRSKDKWRWAYQVASHSFVIAKWVESGRKHEDTSNEGTHVTYMKAWWTIRVHSTSPIETSTRDIGILIADNDYFCVLHVYLSFKLEQRWLSPKWRLGIYRRLMPLVEKKSVYDQV